MSGELANVSARQAEIRLARLIPDILAAHQQAQLHAMEALKYALRCGRLLLEVRPLVKHGTFEALAAEKLKIHPGTARRYMQLAEHWPKVEDRIGPEAAAEMSVTEGIEYIRKHITKKSTLPHNGVEVRAGLRDIPQSEGVTVDDSVVQEVDNHESGEPGRGTQQPDHEHGGEDHAGERADVAPGAATPAGASAPGDQEAHRQPPGAAQQIYSKADAAFGTLCRLIDQLQGAFPSAAWLDVNKELDRAYQTFSAARRHLKP